MKKHLFSLFFIFICIVVILEPQTLYAQLPDNVDTAECTSTPPANAFDIKKKWETPDDGPDAAYTHSAATPLVADLDGNGYPEVLCPWFKYGVDIYGGSNAIRTIPNTWNTYNISVYDGRTGKFKYVIQTPLYSADHQGITIADVDKDGKAEIFILGFDHYVYCFRYNANSGPEDYKWKSEEPVEAANYILMTADVNNDGFADLVCGPNIFNAITGRLILKGEFQPTGTGFCSPTNANMEHANRDTWRGYPGRFYALADMDGDKTLELCAGNTIYKMDITNPISESGNKWSILRKAESNSNIQEWDGTTIVVDFDNDGDLDVVVLGQDTKATSTSYRWNRRYDIYVWDGQTNKIIANTTFSKVLGISIPFAGDINGDGLCELIFNGNLDGNYNTKDFMHVYAYDPTSPGNMKQVFDKTQTQEFSESSGFTVFDFNQDGASEIIYRGESNFFILDGKTLEKLSEPIATCSNTCSEYPIVADVDCDGHADILFTERFIKDMGNGIRDSRGKVACYESATPGAWSPARKVWNQWPYNVVNINEDMTVPKYQFNVATVFPNGKKPFNSFLQQATTLNKDGDMFAPAADVEVIHDDKTFQNLCNQFIITLTFTNKGSMMLNAPYSITVFKNDIRGQVIRTVQKNSNLMVGDTTTVVMRFNESDINNIGSISRFVVAVNDAGQGIAQNGLQQMECNLANNVDSCNFDGLRTSEEFDNPVTICEGETYTVGKHEYSVSGDYIDTLKNQYGCDSIVKTHLTVSSISFDFPTTRYCSEVLPVTLDASSSGAASYEWSTGATTPSIQASTNDGEGQDFWEYFVVVTNGDGCIDTSNTVTIYRNPEVEITSSIDKEQFCSVGEATLTADAVNMVDKSEITWLWNTNETTPTITIETTHEKTFTVEATYNNCKGTASLEVDECPCMVELFNAFTPNGDGINDTFAPKLEATFKSYQLIIYDRWGKSVYKSEDPTESWDGTINGQNAADGVYYYVFTYACMSAPLDLISKHGSITLIR